MYIGSPLQDLPDLEEKLSIFIAKYNYDPMLYSPNENPEMELAFQAGDYLYVYGDVDEVCAVYNLHFSLIWGLCFSQADIV